MFKWWSGYLHLSYGFHHGLLKLFFHFLVYCIFVLSWFSIFENMFFNGLILSSCKMDINHVNRGNGNFYLSYKFAFHKFSTFVFKHKLHFFQTWDSWLIVAYNPTNVARIIEWSWGFNNVCIHFNNNCSGFFLILLLHVSCYGLYNDNLYNTSWASQLFSSPQPPLMLLMYAVLIVNYAFQVQKYFHHTKV